MNTQAVADARLLVSNGMSANKAAIEVGEKYGVARQTIQKWAKAEGTPLGVVASTTAANARVCAREQRQARMEEGLAKLAEAFPVLAEKVGGLVGRDADGTVRACRGILEMVRLVEGEATSRVETVSLDEFARQLQVLEAQLGEFDAA